VPVHFGGFLDPGFPKKSKILENDVLINFQVKLYVLFGKNIPKIPRDLWRLKIEFFES